MGGCKGINAPLAAAGAKRARLAMKSGNPREHKSTTSKAGQFTLNVFDFNIVLQFNHLLGQAGIGESRLEGGPARPAWANDSE